MHISGNYLFDAPQDRVWDALQDPVVLGSVVHACRDVKKAAENEYVGTLDFKAGTIRGIFNGTITLSNLVEPESYDIEVNGQGIPGVVKVTGGMRLEAEGGKTRFHYQGEAIFGGRMASSGQRILEIATKMMIQQSLQLLNGYFIRKMKQIS